MTVVLFQVCCRLHKRSRPPITLCAYWLERCPKRACIEGSNGRNRLGRGEFKCLLITTAAVMEPVLTTIIPRSRALVVITFMRVLHQAGEHATCIHEHSALSYLQVVRPNPEFWRCAACRRQPCSRTMLGTCTLR